MLINNSGPLTLWLPNTSTPKDITSSAADVFNQVLAKAMGNSPAKPAQGAASIDGLAEKGGAALDTDSVAYDAFKNTIYEWKARVAELLKKKEEEDEGKDTAGTTQVSAAPGGAAGEAAGADSAGGGQTVASTANLNFEAVEADPPSRSVKGDKDQDGVKDAFLELLEKTRQNRDQANSISLPLWGNGDAESYLSENLDRSERARARDPASYAASRYGHPGSPLMGQLSQNYATTQDWLEHLQAAR